MANKIAPLSKDKTSTLESKDKSGKLDKDVGEKPDTSRNCWKNICLKMQNCLINMGVCDINIKTTGPIISRHKLTNPLTNSGEFRICSYSINTGKKDTEIDSKSKMYLPCHNIGNNSNYRKRLVLKELIGYNADIICLQDVHSDVYYHSYCPYFHKRGFESQFSRMLQLGYEHGLACFWKKETFDKIEAERFVVEESLQTAKENKKVLKTIKKNKVFAKYMFNKETHMQLITLKSIKHPERVIVLGNVQLVDQFKSVRLLQTAALLRQLDKRVTELTKRGFTTGIICAGDFKCRPQSGIYELICEGSIPKFHPDWMDFKGEDVKGVEMVLESSLQMDNAYGPSQRYTTYSKVSGDWSDYIFYNKDILQVTRIIPIPIEEEWKEYGQLPNAALPSTHLACIADMQYKTGMMDSFESWDLDIDYDI